MHGDGYSLLGELHALRCKMAKRIRAIIHSSFNVGKCRNYKDDKKVNTCVIKQYKSKVG